MKRSRVLTIFGLVLILGTAAYAWYSPFRLMVLVALGRSPVCPLGRAVKSGEHRALLTEAKDRILRNSRLERTDQLFRSPDFGETLPEKIGQLRFDLGRDQADAVEILDVDFVLKAETSELHADQVGDGGD